MRTLVMLSLIGAMSSGSAGADLIEKEVSRLKLRPQTRVCGDVVTLADVLNFSQADPRLPDEIGDKAIATGAAAPAETAVTHDQVVKRLEALGVNMARVLVSGALSCRVTLEAPLAEKQTEGGETPLMRTPSRIDGAATLADLLRAKIEDGLAAHNGRVEVEFEHAGGEFLELTSPPFDFSIIADRGRKVGLREFRVTLKRDGRIQRTVRLGARVKLIKQVLAATTPLNVGAYVRRNSLEYASWEFTRDEDFGDFGIEHVEQVVGQKVKNFVPAGQMVRLSDLKSVDLVRRSQPVTVVGAAPGSANVNMRITGDALDSGGYGDTIRVRLGNSRDNYREVRGLVVGVGTVQMTEGSL